MEPNSNQNVFNKLFINTNNKIQPNQEETSQNKNINIQINNVIFQNQNPINPPQNLFTKKYIYHPNKAEQMTTDNNNNINEIEKNSNNKISSLYPMNQISNLSYLKLSKKVIMNSLNDQKTVFIIQKALQESSSADIIELVTELKGEYRYLILDKYGNFFCKDLFKIIDTKERIAILEELHKTISEDCCHNYATHPLQALVEFSSTEKEYELILFSFNDYNKLLFATTDPNGSYVIQKIIDRIPERFRADFNYIFSSFVGFVCKKKYGIVALKKFIECTRSEHVIQELIKLVRSNFMNFAVDKYGNYLIQYLLEKWNNFPEGKEIKQLIFNNFNVMCKSKYSSFICDNYVKMLNNDEKMRLIKTLDINSIMKSNNPNAFKIIKALGINMNNINNINNINNMNNMNNVPNNQNNQMMFPLSLNSNLNNNNNNNNLYTNYMNFNFGFKNGKYN